MVPQTQNLVPSITLYTVPEANRNPVAITPGRQNNVLHINDRYFELYFTLLYPYFIKISAILSFPTFPPFCTFSVLFFVFQQNFRLFQLFYLRMLELSVFCNFLEKEAEFAHGCSIINGNDGWLVVRYWYQFLDEDKLGHLRIFTDLKYRYGDR